MFFREIYVLVSAIALLQNTARCAEQGSDATLNRIAKAWERTQTQVHSAHFRWMTQQWVQRGALMPAIGLLDDNSGKAVPNEEQTFEYARTAQFRDGLVRYDSEGPTWDGREKRFDHRMESFAWNGNSAVYFDGDSTVPSAFRYGYNSLMRQYDVRVLQFAFRMFQPEWFVFTPEKYEVIETTEPVDGLHCLKVQTARHLLDAKVAKGRQPLKAVYWVCPERSFSVVRYAGVNAATGVPTLQFAIEHEVDENSQIWCPVKWTITAFENGAPVQMATSTVEEYVINAPVAMDAFNVDLPPNTLVTDLVAHEDYILRADGTKRLITQDEAVRGTTYEDWVATKTGAAGLKRGEPKDGFWVAWGWGIGLAFLLIALVIAAWKRLLRQNQS